MSELQGILIAVGILFGIMLGGMLVNSLISWIAKKMNKPEPDDSIGYGVVIAIVMIAIFVEMILR